MTASLARIVAALAVAAGAAVLAGPLPVAVAGGLLLGFVLPGMALLGVLFRRRVLTSVERAVLTPALSMGVLIVAGLAVHAVGLRIDRLAWTVATVGVTLVAVVAALLLRRPAPVGGGGLSSGPGPGSGIGPGISARSGTATKTKTRTGSGPRNDSRSGPESGTGRRPGIDSGLGIFTAGRTASTADDTAAIPAAGPAASWADDTAALPGAGTDPRRAGEETVRISLSGGSADAHTIVMSVVPATTPEEDQRAAAAQEKDRRRRLLRQLLPLVVVAAILGGASWLSFDTSRDTHNTIVTALSAEPSGPVGTNGNRTVRVSASGLLAADGPYTVRVTVPAGTTTLERAIAVTGDGSWTAALSLPGAQRLTVNLYRSGDATAYRTLFISAVD